jgi:hypothetical protein
VTRSHRQNLLKHALQRRKRRRGVLLQPKRRKRSRTQLQRRKKRKRLLLQLERRKRKRSALLLKCRPLPLLCLPSLPTPPFPLPQALRLRPLHLLLAAIQTAQLTQVGGA